MFTFTDPVIYTLEFGKTKYQIDLTKFTQEDNLRLVTDGDSKLFKILNIIDLAGIKLDLEECPELKRFGITAINSEHTEIIPKENIIFLDDKKGCVNLVDLAGFTSI